MISFQTTAQMAVVLFFLGGGIQDLIIDAPLIILSKMEVLN